MARMMNVVIAVTSLLPCAVQAAQSEVLELELRLTGALRPQKEQADGSYSLILDLTRTGKQWERVWGLKSDGRRPELHQGRVRKAEIGDGQMALTIDLQETKNVCQVDVNLTRSADGRMTGTYSVTMPTWTNKGEAEGRIKPQRPALPSGYVPLKQGEHPRILFRDSDLPALREKAKTPFGQAMLKHMADDGTGAGIKWQLTREQAAADQARQFVEKLISGKAGMGSGRDSMALVPEQVALAFDLCFEAWPAEFKAQVVGYMIKTVQKHLSESMPGNKHICSNWNARAHSGAAITMLALWGEKGPMPARPSEKTAAAFWEDDVTDWKRLGEVNMDYQQLFERTRYILYQFCREATGTGGFRGECSHYGLLAAGKSIAYASYYRQMFGADLSPYNDITWMIPRMMFGQDYPESGGPPVPLNINGVNTISGEFFAYAFPIAPERWRNAVLWAWNRQSGIAGPDGWAQPGKEKAATAFNGPSAIPWTFVNYPLDVKPEHPSKVMPLTWEAPDHGYYGFRSGWTGKGDFVLQVHAKSHITGGWNLANAGTFRLYGMGQSWNDAQSGRNGSDWEENRVMMADDLPGPSSGQGRATHTDFRPDGSGALTLNMDDIYDGSGGKALYTMYGNFRRPTACKDLGIRALRAMAVDYSGKCGSPCLFVMVDRIRGGKEKTWTWNLGDAALLPKVAIDGNTFTIPKGAATLRGFFVTPRPARVRTIIKDVDLPANGTDQATVHHVPSIFAQGGDDFFLVATVQEGKATVPEIKTEGEGLQARAVVGRRVISFDGTKIVIADKP